MLLFLLKNVHYTYEGQDQALQKGEKINGHTQTKVYVNLTSKRHCKIKSSRFGIPTFAPTTQFVFLLAKPNSSNVHLPRSIAIVLYVIVLWFVGVFGHCLHLVVTLSLLAPGCVQSLLTPRWYYIVPRI
jgi:hypothetical protein